MLNFARRSLITEYYDACVVREGFVLLLTEQKMESLHDVSVICSVKAIIFYFCFYKIFFIFSTPFQENH